MFDPSMVTAWLLTYLLHSTLFLALAWLAARGPLRRRPALEEAAWRFALVAALVTASVQLGEVSRPELVPARVVVPELFPQLVRWRDVPVPAD